MLNIKARQIFLKQLGFYSGAIDSIEGPATKAAYKKLQAAYFYDKDVDGLYGINTNTLLINAIRVADYTKDFSLKEFKCKCGGKHCTGYPALLDIQLLKNLQKLRDKFGAVRISSGLRCEMHNAAVGGARGSRHRVGKAADVIIQVNPTIVMDYWKRLPGYRYTYCNEGGSHPHMGSAVHVDVR